MNNSEQAYESNILKLAINKYLDKKFKTYQKDLETIELNKNELVWDVVTTIYNQSGYKVSMSFARDVIDQRIKDIKDKLKQDEEIAIFEMIRIKAEQEMIRIKAEQEHTHQEQLKAEKQIKIIDFIKTLPPQLKFDETKLDVFLRVHKVCCENYEHYEFNKLDDEQLLTNEVFMKILETQIFSEESHTGSENNLFWGFSLNVYLPPEVKVLLGCEEEFELEIKDSEAENLVTFNDIVNLIYSYIVK